MVMLFGFIVFLVENRNRDFALIDIWLC